MPIISAAFAGGFIDKEVESKGVSRLPSYVDFEPDVSLNKQLDFIDRERAKRDGEH